MQEWDTHRVKTEHGVYHVLQIPQQEPMAQKSSHSILVLPNRLDARSNSRPGLAGHLFHPRVRQFSILLQRLILPLSPPLTSWPNSTNIVLLIVSAVCTIVSFTEIVLFAATRLHPLTYLTLQLVKTSVWFVLFVLSAVNTTRVQIEMQAQAEQGYNYGSSEEYFYILWFAEPLVLL